MKLSDLPNLGPASALMLSNAGIHSRAELEKLGSVAAYLKVIKSGASNNLNLLWAIEGAISGRNWKQVAKDDRLSLLMQLEDYQVEMTDEQA